MVSTLLEYQKNSYRKILLSEVVSCEKSLGPENLKGSELYRITLKDTILFPEGGGQPEDHGFLDDISVVHVRRENGIVAHYTLSPLAVGKEVTIKLDWERRFDHMQQHSAQHLITAIAEQDFNMATTSWWLGETYSFIELDIDFNRFDEKFLKLLEERANELILQGAKVEVTVYEEGDEKPEEARTRGLPDNHSGPIRVITIDGVDTNMCCGTHVNNLLHLQMIKILEVEKGKKGKTNLYFIAGRRVSQSLSRCLGREKQLSSLLKNGPEEHVMLVDKLIKSTKQSEKVCSSLWKEVAKNEAKLFKELPLKPKLYELHRKDGTTDFVNTFSNEVKEFAEGTVFFITYAETQSEAHVMLIGPEETLKSASPMILKMFDGKGAARGGRFQAKVRSLAKRKEVLEFLKKESLLPTSE
ncbi:alanyl-tRNA editing protein Aarsd1-B-like isoform X1 [Artemia franciscana]|uniref:alanyl-tRNA editing protein Aarsd1-B-like isoform X1 n=1 Tax=Artemia franciscana TaxID=6661 RepID=UPI0032D9B1EA